MSPRRLFAKTAMPVVVDASAIAAVILLEPEGPTIRAHCDGETLLAPHLLDYELANVVRSRIRKRPDDEVAARALSYGLSKILVERISVRPTDMLELSLRTGLTPYDAAYLWLALNRDAELITLDRELARAERALRGDLS
jgi:predicted nucleic acid-binding protein